jgi:hypothetical protein
MEPAVNPVALRNVTIFTNVQHSSNTITVLKLNHIPLNLSVTDGRKARNYRYFCATVLAREDTLFARLRNYITGIDR